MAQLRKNIHKSLNTNAAFHTPPAQLNTKEITPEEIHPGFVKYLDRLIEVFRYKPFEKRNFYQVFFKPGRGKGKDFPRYSEEPKMIAPEDPGYLPPLEEGFKGWSFAPENPFEDVYAPGDEIPLTGEISNIYAYYGRQETKMTYWANNGTEDHHDHWVDSGTHWLPVQLFEPADPRLNFLGWDRDKDARTGKIKGTFIVKAKGFNYFSIWSHSIVEFKPNGGSGEMADAVIDSDYTYELPDCGFNPPNSWEYFIGWAHSPEEPVIPEKIIPVDGIMQVYAKWDQYILKFDANGGEGEMAPIRADSEYFTLPVCSFVAPGGKVFEGWAYTPDGEVITDTKIKADANITLYAKYRAIKVSFKPGDGTGTMADVFLVNAWIVLPSATFTPPLAKHFIGWSYTEGGEIITDPVLFPTEDLTLYANYDVNRWTIHFDANGGTGTKDDITMIEGYFDIPENTFFTPPDGKKFIGWALTGGGKPLDSNHIYIGKDTIIYAIYSNIVVSYDANGGTGVQRDTVLTSWTFVLPTATTFIAPTKKHFIGWAYDPNGAPISTATIQVIQDTRLYAVWDDNKWTVTLDANGGEGEVEPIEMPEGNFTLPYCPFTPPDGKRFLGWSRMRTEPVISEDSIYINSNTTLYAIYIKVKVSFNPGAGTGAMIPVYLNSWEYALPPCEFTPPPTYRFEGWSYSVTGDIITTPKIIVKADTTLYAKYVTDYVDIKFDANGGTGKMDPMKVVRTMNFQLPENGFTPPADDKKFVGWKVDELGDVIYQPGDEIAIKSNYGATVFAQWDSVFHTVDFDANGGTGEMDSVVVDERAKYQLPDVEFIPPEHEHPIGWAYSPDGPVIEEE